jgi:hypothetical protein
MAQQILVIVLVSIAFLYSAWRLMPARRRLQLLLAADRWSAKHPALHAWRTGWLQARITRAAGPGCAGCAAAHAPPRSPR